MSAAIVFVTGAPRSGTTLVDKLLWNLPAIDCFSQPLPLLLTQLKTSFLKNNAAPAQSLAIPLGDQQFENAYPHTAFTDFLQDTPFGADLLQNAFTAMDAYSGQYFKPDDPQSALANWKGGDLTTFAAHYFSHFAQKTEEAITFTAWKETGAEEFLPFFLARGMRAIVILRDPRDIAASLYYGRSKNHAGQGRPLLFMARQWRKSAAWFAHYGAHDQVQCVQYEALVRNPKAQVQQWADWLGVDDKPGAINLHTQNGQHWQGNSSFDTFTGISSKAIGRYADILGKSERNFIEALCFAEMTHTGYQPQIAQKDVSAILQAGPGTDYLGRKTLAHYSYNQQRQKEERERWQNLTSPKANYNPAQFLFDDHYLALRKTVATS